MDIRCVTFDRLNSDELAAWSAIQRTHNAFANPFFRPEFSQLVAESRGGVEVAVLEDAGTPVGFFPFQRTVLGASQPVGGGLSELHGLIAGPDVACNPHQLLRACRLTSWRFDHLVPNNGSFDDFAWSSAESPYIDLSEGFDGYVAGRSNGKRLLSEFGQRRRKLEREVGPIRCEAHSADPAVLDTCLEWKAAQARRTGRMDIFNQAWIVDLCRRTLAFQGDDYSAVMSVFWAGDRVAGINFGAQSGGVFHPWFPTYNVEFGDYSPGYLHWLKMMQSAETLGIRRIILGKGNDAYKKRLVSAADTVLQGCLDVHPALTAARRAWWHTRDSVKASPLRAPAQVPARIVNRISTWLMFR